MDESDELFYFEKQSFLLDCKDLLTKIEVELDELAKGLGVEISDEPVGRINQVEITDG